MSRRAAMQVSRLLLQQHRNRTFTTAILKDVVISNGASKIPKGATYASHGILRHWSSMASEVSKDEKAAHAPKLGPGHENAEDEQGGKIVVNSYWGVAPPKISKADGSPWRWNSFRPWETYTADTSIDVKKHHEAKTFMDKFAYWTVQSLKYPTYFFFQVTIFFLNSV